MWDVATGQELLTLKGHTEVVTSVCFSPDGKRLASASEDETVKVWDTTTGKELLNLIGHMSGVTSVCFSPEGNRLASANGRRSGFLRSFASMNSPILSEIIVWETTTGRALYSLRGHADEISCICFSPDGQHLASASNDETLKVWDTITSQESLPFYGEVVGFTADSKRLIRFNLKSVDQQSGLVIVRDGETDKELFTLKGLDGAHHYSPDGKYFAIDTKDTVRVWDVATGRELFSLRGQTLSCFSPDGKRIASVSEDNTVRVWDAASGRELQTLKGHTGAYYVCFSPDGKQLASASIGEITDPKSGEVKLWDMVTGRELFTRKGHNFVYCFSPDSQHIATASNIDFDTINFDDNRDPNEVIIWDTGTGRDLFTLKGHTGPVKDIDFTPDGKRLASSSADKTVKIWDASTGQELLTLKGHWGTVFRLFFSPDGKRLVSTCLGEIKLWDIASGQDRLILKGHSGKVVSVCFNSNGKRIIAKSEEGEVRSWDASTGQEIVPCADPAPPEGQQEAISPDRSLRIQAENNTVRVWRTNDNRPSSDLVFAARLNDVPSRLRWHRSGAADSEANQQWYAAAFHLRQLIAAKEPDAEQLKVRLKRCEDKLRQP